MPKNFSAQALDSFTKAYIEAALFSSTDETDNKKRAAQEAGYTFRKQTTLPGGEQFHVWDKDGGEFEETYEFESEAWDAAWEDMGGGCADTALDKNYDASDFTPEALEKIKADCAKFQEENSAALESATCTRGSGEYSQSEQAGHDFWLTRNGHGAGFWDGDWSEPEATLLTTASEAFGECDIYVTDDGELSI